MNSSHSILKKELYKHYPFISSSEIDDFVNLWTIHKKLKKFDFLSTQGKIERNLYFILEGTFHQYYSLDSNFTVSFAIPHMFYNSFESFVTQQPSKVFVQALSAAEVIGISRESFYKTIHSNWNFERAYRLKTETQLLEQYERDFLLKLPSSQRVLKYLKTQPQIFQKIPQKYIASFLGLSPETFSRILKKSKS